MSVGHDQNLMDPSHGERRDVIAAIQLANLGQPLDLGAVVELTHRDRSVALGIVDQEFARSSISALLPRADFVRLA